MSSWTRTTRRKLERDGVFPMPAPKVKVKTAEEPMVYALKSKKKKSRWRRIIDPMIEKMKGMRRKAARR